MFGKREVKEPRKVIPMETGAPDAKVSGPVAATENNPTTEAQLNPGKQEQPEEPAETRKDPFQKGITKERLQEIKVNIYQGLYDFGTIRNGFENVVFKSSILHNEHEILLP